MARVDAARGAVELSIVYVGGHAATGAAALTALHAGLPAPKSEPISLSTSGDRVVVFECTPSTPAALDGLTVSVRVSVLVGAPAQRRSARELLAQADGVVLLLREGDEATAENDAAVQRMFEDLALRGVTGRDVPVVVQLDSDAAQETRSSTEPLVAVGLAGVPCVTSNVAARAGVLEAFQACYELVAQRALDSEELRSSSVAVLVRERRLNAKLDGLELAVLQLGERVQLLSSAVLTVGETEKLLAEGSLALQQAQKAQAERLDRLESLLTQSVQGVDAMVRAAATSLQRDLSSVAEGIDELRTDARQKRKGFWRSAGT